MINDKLFIIQANKKKSYKMIDNFFHGFDFKCTNFYLFIKLYIILNTKNKLFLALYYYL